MTKPTIGVLILNTSFPRIIGDIGNPASFEYPTIYHTVETATTATVVTRQALAPRIESDVEAAALSLAATPVSVITTSCGFLSPLQNQLAQLTQVPVITSSLTLLPLLTAWYGHTEKLGVITFDKSTLHSRHLGKHAPAAIEGLQNNDSLRKTISQDLTELNREQAEQEVLAACDRLTNNFPAVKAIILECTNLSPYKSEIRSHTGLSVYDIVDAVHWLLRSG